MLAGELAPTLVAVFTGAAIYRPAGFVATTRVYPSLHGSIHVGHALSGFSYLIVLYGVPYRIRTRCCRRERAFNAGCFHPLVSGDVL